MRVNGNIPSLINGVSQQPPSLRLPTQGAEQINAVSSLLDGLTKRPPTEFVAKLSSNAYIKPFVHWVNRDEVEKYAMLFYPTHVEVADVNGVTYPVVETVDGDLSYLNCPSPYRQMRALTINDTTFVVNQTRPTKLTSDLVAARPYEALVWIRAGSYGTDYTIKVNGSAVTFTTSTTDVTELSTSFIATQLTTALVGILPVSFQVTRFDNAIWIRQVDNAVFNITTADSNGNRNHSTVVGEAAHFADLPDNAPNGFVAKIRGSVEDKADDYWVKFSTRVGIAFGPGTWIEAPQPGVHYKFLADTMPHQLVRKQDDSTGSITGTPSQIYFEFGAVSWRDRQAGDGNSIPTPSFIGYTLSDLFLHRGRLGFLAQSNVVLSQAGDLLNFWRQTATTLLDDDPIDTPAVNDRSVNLRHAIGFSGELLIFADHSQFVLKGAELLTPRTVSIQLATQYSSHTACKPVNAGDVIYFPMDNGSFTGMKEYYVDGITQERKARSITDQCPRYIGGSGLRMSVSPTENMLFLITDINRDTLWVYQWFWNGQEKVQSSWSKWTFGEDSILLAAGFLGDVLHLVTVHGDGTYLESVRLDPGYTDDHAEYVTHLDRRVNETSETLQVLYNDVTNQTTINTDFIMNSDSWIVVTRDNGDDAWRPGRVVTQVGHGLQQIVVNGDIRPGFWLGKSYSMQYEFSTPYLRSQSQLGGVSTVEEGRLQLLDFTVKYDNTGYFRAVVVPDYRDPAEYPMTGQVLLSPRRGLPTGLGSLQIRSGALKFPVLSRNKNVRIVVINDTHLPSYFSGAEWNANYTTKSQRV